MNRCSKQREIEYAIIYRFKIIWITKQLNEKGKLTCCCKIGFKAWKWIFCFVLFLFCIVFVCCMFLFVCLFVCLFVYIFYVICNVYNDFAYYSLKQARPILNLWKFCALVCRPNKTHYRRTTILQKTTLKYYTCSHMRHCHGNVRISQYLGFITYRFRNLRNQDWVWVYFVTLFAQASAHAK